MHPSSRSEKSTYLGMNMNIKLGIVMDPIETILPKKDSSLAMLLAAQRKGWALYYMTSNNCYLESGEAKARMCKITVYDSDEHWFEKEEPTDQALSTLNIILMRIDPPFNMNYIYTTYLLEYAQSRGTLIVNNPQALRDVNEKLFTGYFPDCSPGTLVTAQSQRIKEFLNYHKDIIVKPLDGMGGTSIFRLTQNDPNINVVLETMTQYNQVQIMAQVFIPEIVKGDKRVLLVDGEPIPYALARIPTRGETRGNLAVGGKGVAVKLSQHDRWICNQIAPTLKEMGLIFVGLDIIGDYLTEINVTSPTCIRELDRDCDLDIAMSLMDVIEQKI